MDVQLCLTLIDVHWDKIFSLKMPPTTRSRVKELKSIRNQWAHKTSGFDDMETIRALDTMALVSEAFDAETAAELRAMWNAKLNRQTEPVAVALKPWRNVIEPNPDVSQGRYRQSEFAAKAVPNTQIPLNFFRGRI